MTPTNFRWDALWLNVNVATMRPTANSYGEIRDAAVAIKDGHFAWVGQRSELPAGASAAREHNGGSGWMTPGLIDCHTHVVYAGTRSNEFEARLNGASYEEIARRGGGILSTVRATRATSEEQLYAESLPRVRRLIAEGVTTIEIKSGYGLERDAEVKMLRVARRIGELLPLRVKTTFLGAHALPPEFAGRPDDYIDSCIEQMLPAVQRESLADAVDAFCENIAFSPAQVSRVFDAARRLGLPVKLHAEQLSNQGGAELVASYQGLSADHLECLTPAGISAMAKSGTIAVLLPGAFYFLRETRVPPIDGLRQAGVAIAVATDCNPGTSPMTSVLQAMNMACVLFRLTPREALAGATINAARALGLAAEIGSIEVGKAADLALWEISSPAELAYTMSGHLPKAIVSAGEIISS